MNTKISQERRQIILIQLFTRLLVQRGETGEVCEKIKKILRDKQRDFSNPEFLLAVKKELGDVLWYVANLAADLGIYMEDIAVTNIEKLRARKASGTLSGSGDNR